MGYHSSSCGAYDTGRRPAGRPPATLSMRTPDELRNAGLVQDPETGQWFARGHYRVKTATRIPVGDPGQASELERNSGHGALGAVQVQGRDTGRFLVRVTSYRKRLLDYDNLCEKYHVDCLRYSGLIPGDAPGTTEIEVREEKIEPGAAERVRIEIFKI